MTLAAQPAVAAGLRAAHAAAWEVADPVILELCRLRIAQVLGNTAEFGVRTPAAVAAGLDEDMVAQLSSWFSEPRFGSRERACLDFCEQSLIDVSNITNDQTEAISAELGVQGLADFVSALLVVEQRQRLRLAWGRLFNEETTTNGS